MRSQPSTWPLNLTLQRAPGAGPTPSARLREQLHAQLREAILDGRLATGLRLPATRALACQLGVSRNTVALVYEQLVAEGYAAARQGSGTRVLASRRECAGPLPPARTAPAPAVPALRFDFRLGVSDVGSFPFDIWQRLAGRATRQHAPRLARSGDPAGDAALREAVALHVSQARAVACSARHVVVTSGARQGFDLLARELAASGARRAVVEDPGYLPVRQALAAAGLQVLGVPVDREGLVVERLPPDVQVVCVTPSHQYPLGVPLSASRRRALVAWAERCGAAIVEDDYDGEYRFESRTLDALQTLAPQRVCYVGTFSKTLFSGLRLGYLVLPELLAQRIAQRRVACDGYPPSIAQWTLAAFIAEGHLARHLRRMQRRYAQRRDRVQQWLQPWQAAGLAALPAFAGLHLTLDMSGWGSAARLRALVARAAAEGLLLDDLGHCAYQATADPWLPLSYAQMDGAQLDRGLARLGALLA